jgi:sphinganine-1-phosphate aldolase
MGNLFGRITGRSGPYFVILSAVVAKDLALLLRRKQNFNVLDIFHKLLSGGGFIRTCIADAFGLALVWRIIQYCLAWNVFFRKLSWVEQKEQIMGAAFSYLQLLPFVSKKIRKERDSMEAGLRKSLKECDHLKGAVKYYKLPTKGRSTESIISEMESYVEKEDFVWKEGFVSGAVYHGEANHLACQNEALTLYSLSNPLHPELWPSLRKYEAEIISMTASFLNGGDENVVGSITSGGTESIFMAVKSHREYGWRYKGISLPEIIVPVTAHAAFEKACEALKVQCIKLPVDQTTFQVDPADVKGRLTGNTILIVGSAPNYPQVSYNRKMHCI